MNAGAGHKTLQLEQQRRVASSQEEMAGGKPGTKVTASRSTVVETVGDEKKRRGIDAASTDRCETVLDGSRRRARKGIDKGSGLQSAVAECTEEANEKLQLGQQRWGGWR